MNPQPLSPRAEALWDAAADLLRRHDRNGRTLAAPDLYPHQWSWDSAFIALGWAQVDLGRAALELETLLAAQWSNGKIPHIVFDPAAPPDSYAPGPQHWVCEVPDGAPAGCTPHTSGLCQPPVHAIAADRLWQAAARQGSPATDRIRAFLEDAFAPLMAWHAYLLDARDIEGSGLVSIYHPWESGMDNSPRWDQPLATVHPLADEALSRPDLGLLHDASQRPSQAAYGRYHWLVGLLRRHCYDDRTAQVTHPFLVKDVFTSGLLVAANRALLRIARLIGATGQERRQIRTWIDAGRRGLEGARDPVTGLARDYDVRAGHWLSPRTVGGFAELVAGTTHGDHLRDLIGLLESEAFAGAASLRWATPPSTSPLEPEFDPRRYWRGPSWPVVTWLLWWALRRARQKPAAERLRQAGLDQIWCSGEFPEYLEPFSGEPLGSLQQSWTAAVTLDWLDSGRRWGQPAQLRGHRRSAAAPCGEPDPTTDTASRRPSPVPHRSAPARPSPVRDAPVRPGGR